MRYLLPIALLLSLTPWACAASEGADSREVFDQGSPRWLRAVGKLRVPGIRIREGHSSHQVEDCSATLVAAPRAARADTIVTAWHCLEHYRDLSRPIVFTLLPGSDSVISAEAYRLEDGGGMHADWAILRLYQPITRETIPALNIMREPANQGLPVTMAGYSRDDGKGHQGALLTFDRDCAITGDITRTPAGGSTPNTDCLAFKGASGGAVVQVAGDGEARLTGVVSQGDGLATSTFVPVTRFMGAINRSLNGSP